MIGLDGPDRRLFEIDRRREIGETLGEVHRAVTNREPRHLADHGLGEVRGAVALKGLGELSAKPSQAGSRFFVVVERSAVTAFLRRGLFRSRGLLRRSQHFLWRGGLHSRAGFGTSRFHQAGQFYRRMASSPAIPVRARSLCRIKFAIDIGVAQHRLHVFARLR